MKARWALVLPPGMARFWLLHGAYPSFEMINLALGAVATILLVQATLALPIEAQKSPT